ncbi:ParB family protein [Acerihabitans sp. TG2]|uniref:ParB family protein n=1 Tax=Acerihabitans sp. TG2 TaxID=3096008 RepID=UPI002B2252D6|nr:ParB family protein [Acerihabitans sp. TG2]MEA9392657.1 ParB family protein [Acerihabitans sp. TG2]
MSNRRVIGRTFKSTGVPSDDTEISSQQTFTLSSGRRAIFTLQNIAADSVPESTFVIQETNGRDQSALTAESLKDITKTIRLQQFFPCIGVKSGDKIEIIDGSRRRASAILCHTSLNVMVTEDSITADDARKLARDIQTAREHNLREIGIRFLTLKNSGLSQKEIAEQEGTSQAKVTRALQAASVSQALISIFPVQSELTFSDYKTLTNIEELLSSKELSAESLVENVSPEIELLLADPRLAEDEVKNRIIKILIKEAALLTSTSNKEKAIVSNLWAFSDKDRFARKRTKGRMFTYEFNRLPKEVYEELDRTINEILKKHLT